MKILGMILLCHVALTAWLAWTLNIWSDESCTLEATGGAVGYAVHQAIYFEWQPPAYHVALCLWRKLNDSIFFARLFSIGCTSLATMVVYRLVKRAAPSTPPSLAAAAFAFHPYTVYAAVEIRLYAFATLLSTLLLLLFWDGYCQDQPKARWTHLIAALVSIFTNILLGLLLIAQSVVLLAGGRYRLLGRYLLAMACVGALYAPLFGLQLNVMREVQLPKPTVSLVDAANYVVGSSAFMVWPLPRIDATIALRAGLLLLLIVVAGVLFWTQRARIGRDDRLLLVYTAAVAALLAAFMVATGLQASPRYAFVLLAPCLSCWALVLGLSPSRPWRIALWTTTLALGMATLIVTYAPLCKTGDWIRVAGYLEAHERPHQPVLAFTSEVGSLLAHYYDGTNQVWPVPGPQRFDRFNYADFVIPDRETLDDRLRPALEGVQECWLVTFEPAVFDAEDGSDRMNYHLLETFLNERFEEVERQEFWNTTVRLLRRKSG